MGVVGLMSSSNLMHGFTFKLCNFLALVSTYKRSAVKRSAVKVSQADRAYHPLRRQLLLRFQFWTLRATLMGSHSRVSLRELTLRGLCGYSGKTRGTRGENPELTKQRR